MKTLFKYVTRAFAACFALILLCLGVEGATRWLNPTWQPIRVNHPFYGYIRPANLDADGFVTDKFGLRGDPITLEKPEDTFRIIVVGASVVEGLTIPVEDTFPMVARRLLNEATGGHPKVEVTTLTSPGQGTIQIHGQIAGRVLPFQPDLVLELDAADFYKPLAPNYEPTMMHLDARPDKWWVENSRFINWLTKPDVLSNIGVQMRRAVPETDLPDDQLPSMNRFVTSLRESALLCRGAGVRYGVMTQAWIYKDLQPPEEDEVLWLTLRTWGTNYSTRTARRLVDRYNDAIRELAQKDDLLLIDLDRAAPHDLAHFFDDVHPTRAGHAAFGAEVAKVLLDREILPRRAARTDAAAASR